MGKVREKMMEDIKDIGSRRVDALERIVASHREITMESALPMIRRYRHRVPFAVVKMSGEYFVEGRIQRSARDLADLSLLLPIMLALGSGEPLSERLGYTNKYRGIRITKPEEMPTVVQVAEELTRDLVQRIEAYNGRAEAVIPTPANPIFNFDWLEHIKDDEGRPFYVGEVGIAPIGEEARCMNVEDARSLVATVGEGRMPVISPIVYHALRSTLGVPSKVRKPLNPDADDIARVVTDFTGPEWLVFVTENAGSLSIDLEKAKWYAEKQYTMELIKQLFPESPKLQEHYRNADWKVEAAISMALNGHKVAVVDYQNLLPFLLSRGKNSERYSRAVLNESFGKQLRLARLRRAEEVRRLETPPYRPH